MLLRVGGGSEHSAGALESEIVAQVPRFCLPALRAVLLLSKLNKMFFWIL